MTSSTSCLSENVTQWNNIDYRKCVSWSRNSIWRMCLILSIVHLRAVKGRFHRKYIREGWKCIISFPIFIKCGSVGHEKYVKKCGVTGEKMHVNFWHYSPSSHLLQNGNWQMRQTYSVKSKHELQVSSSSFDAEFEKLNLFLHDAIFLVLRVTFLISLKLTWSLLNLPANGAGYILSYNFLNLFI